MSQYADLAVPTVHLNGTSKKELMQQYLDAIRALKNARDIMQQGGPHGRDYYVQGNEATQVAIAQHRVRLQKVNDVIAELETIGLAVVKQGKD